MLDALATFQRRLKEKDPIKAKSKLRFVVGMKQVINACKAKKVKLVLLAPDTEVIEDIDKKLSTLQSIAQEKEIPMIYTMNRRRLGRACQLSMRQSVVGVYDPNGVYEQFKKIIQYIISLQEVASGR
jgi:ribosomal protein L7Ae-like RNA K-turn-binding protein